jgi:tetratricopeptide (TPR) repeat protein
MNGTDLAELVERGKSHYLAGEFVEASRVLREAVKIAPESTETWRALGFALMSAGNPSDAINAFKTAIGLNPQDADSVFGLGLVQRENGDCDAAITTFDSVLAIKPTHARARRALVESLLRKSDLLHSAGRRADCGPPLQRAFKFAPGSIDTVKPYVDWLFEQQKNLEAFEAAVAAKLAAPNDPVILELHSIVESDPRVVKAKLARGFV